MANDSIYSDHVHATDAAIDFAGKDGKAGRPRKFWCKRTEGRCEPFGLTDATRTPARQAILQMAGPTGISPAMTTPLRYRQVPIRPASPLLGHRTPIRIASIFADAVKLMPVVYARTVLDPTQAPWWSATQSRRAIWGSPPFPELTEKNRSGIGLNLQELNRPQRRITNVANC